MQCYLLTSVCELVCELVSFEFIYDQHCAIIVDSDWIYSYLSHRNKTSKTKCKFSAPYLICPESYSLTLSAKIVGVKTFQFSKPEFDL